MAAYAQVLHTSVAARHARSRTQTWLEACGRIGSHQVRVWTVVGPEPDSTEAGVA